MKASRDYAGDGFRIEYLWKEQVVYWEGSRGFLFDAAWGVEPGILIVPSTEVWAEIMPAWLRERRAEIVSRLRAHSGHDIREDVHGTYRNEPEARDLRLSDG